MIDGILPIDKPQGWTSHDVVARVRRLAGQRQVGHAGTLDPLATGLLLIVLGRATRLSNVLMDAPKTYLAEIVLGATTVTDDAEGPLLERSDPGQLGESTIAAALGRFTGEIQQRPPAYSAVKRDGQKLYQLARRGEPVEAPERTVCVHDLALVRWKTPRLRLRIRCGSGTYIRSIARDLGRDLGVGGYLHALRRVHSGYFDVREAVTPDQLAERDIATTILPLDRPLAGWQALVISDTGARCMRDGRPIAAPEQIAGMVRVYSERGTLVALARAEGGCARPVRVFGGDANADRS